MIRNPKKQANSHWLAIAAFYADLSTELIQLNRQILLELAQYKAVDEYENRIKEIESRSESPGFLSAGRKEKTYDAG